MTVHLHIGMPRMTKEGVTKMFAILRRFINEPGNSELVEEIRDWFILATDTSLQTYRETQTAYRSEYRPLHTGMKRSERNRIGENNTRLEKELKVAKRVNERLEDRFNLFQEMFKGM